MKTMKPIKPTTWTMTKLHRAMMENQGWRLMGGAEKNFRDDVEYRLSQICKYAVDGMMADEELGYSPFDWFTGSLFPELCELVPEIDPTYIKGQMMVWRSAIENAEEMDSFNEDFQYRAAVTRALTRMEMEKRGLWIA